MAGSVPERSSSPQSVRALLRKMGVAKLVKRMRGDADLGLSMRRALAWARAQELPGGGIRVVAGEPAAYPEVTGYYIPTLLTWGEHDYAIRCARWLMSIQNPDGSWSDPAGNTAYTFDTGQILKGLVAVRRRMPEADQSIRRGCDWLLTQVQPDGRVSTPDKTSWRIPGRGRVSEYIHLYCMEPLRDAGRIFNEQRYLDAVDRALAYHLPRTNLAYFNTLSHFHAYIMEALVDLGQPEAALRGMNEVAGCQRKDGAVPAYWDVDWVCSTGLAQYALVWYKLNRLDRGRKALERVSRLQNRSGGFYGSYGHGANYYRDKEITWAVKYFLDASYWHIRTSMDQYVDDFHDSYPKDDPRVIAVERALGELSGLRVLDAGCGKGPYARAYKEKNPSAEIWGLNMSEVLLSRLPAGIKGRQGTLLDIPFQNDSFDRVYSTEAIEHTVNQKVAVAELCRVTKPGGRVIILDKNDRYKNAVRREAWEAWPGREEVEGWLKLHCKEVSSALVGNPFPPQQPDYFVVWQGIRK